MAAVFLQAGRHNCHRTNGIKAQQETLNSSLLNNRDKDDGKVKMSLTVNHVSLACHFYTELPVVTGSTAESDTLVPVVAGCR